MKIREQRKTYMERNRWLLPICVVAMIWAANFIIRDMPGISFKIPEIIIYSVSTIGIIYAGALNAFTSTATAVVFRALLLISGIATLIYFLFVFFSGR